MPGDGRKAKGLGGLRVTVLKKPAVTRGDRGLAEAGWAVVTLISTHSIVFFSST